ncbi:hypothetical protein ACO22_07317 [Paracoccidioides brasiliensis]|uniref:Uncharacterized protein n=1 Tax=Paracoccidioides brasiliensis TaxID=121759 RepID=A0A1D2J514_PARBR|nr:hypothetical protein ACO22_07317 [Paracoccidioides brasiliensis]
MATPDFQPSERTKKDWRYVLTRPTDQPRAIHSDEDHVYNELAAIFDSIFDDEKALRDTVTRLRMERNDAAAQAAIKQGQINELIAERDELSHTLV